MGFSKKGKRISKSIMKRYLAQKHRGSQGYGYVALYKEGDSVRISVGRSTEEAEIREQIMKEHSAMILLHHRMPTSTPNMIEATHPIFVSNDELDHDYFVVHNGVINNASELRKVHEGLGYVYSTVIETELVTHHTIKKSGKKYFTGGTKNEKFNDSESLAIEVARYLDGMTRRIDTVGGVATIAWKINKETGKLVSISYGHNAGRPITITDNNDHFFLASEGGTDIPEDIMYTLSTDGDSIGTTSQVPMAVGFNTEYGRNRGSNDYTYSHINYTPALPAPAKPSINNDIKDKKYGFRRDGKDYNNYDEYREEKFGFNKHLRKDWDKDEDKLDKFMKKNSVGFTNEGNESELSEDEYRIDTSLDKNGEFFMKTSENMVKSYLELEDLMQDVKADIDTAEMLMHNNSNQQSIKILTDEIKESEDKMDAIQEKMNTIEDKYTELFPSRSSFRVLLDAYIEQTEGDGILYDIQMEDREVVLADKGHF